MSRKIIFISIIIIIGFCLLIPLTVLQVVRGSETEEILYQTVTKPGDRFSVLWIHSVSKQPVIETYEIRDDLRIGIYEMIFDENGPNLPAGPEQGTKWEIKNGQFRVYNYSLVFDEVPVRIGKVIANHTLIYKDEKIPLKEIDRPGGFVKIKAVKISMVKYFFGGVKIWLKMKLI